MKLSDDEFKEAVEDYEKFEKQFLHMASNIITRNDGFTLENAQAAASVAQTLMCLHQILSDCKHGRPF